MEDSNGEDMVKTPELPVEVSVLLVRKKMEVTKSALLLKQPVCVRSNKQVAGYSSSFMGAPSRATVGDFCWYMCHNLLFVSQDNMSFIHTVCMLCHLTIRKMVSGNPGRDFPSPNNFKVI